MRSVLLLTMLLPWLCACGDLDVRSVRTGPVVPATLLGEWHGTWQASGSSDTGPLVLRVQEFAGQPVVRIEFPNPCLEPRTYDLVVAATAIELRADGVPVLAATVSLERRMDGIYQCPAQSGTWSAAWQRDLPAVVDLSGDWAGSLLVAGQAVRPVALDLQQTVENGEVRLVGLLDLGAVWPFLIPVRGTVAFRDAGFDLVLQTAVGGTPSLLMTGLGTPVPMQVAPGLLQTLGDPILPFASAVFDIVRRE